MGGPLIVIPVSALGAWRGSTGSGMVAGDATDADDYDRACAVDDLAGAIAVGGSGVQALVLGDEPATSCYLPEHRAFLRWLAADSADGLKAAAEAVLADPATRWEECGTWVTDGPAVLMDSAEAGAELNVEYPGGGCLRRHRFHCPLLLLEGPRLPYRGGRRELGWPGSDRARRGLNGRFRAGVLCQVVGFHHRRRSSRVPNRTPPRTRPTSMGQQSSSRCLSSREARYCTHL